MRLIYARRVSIPPAPREFTRDELVQFNGKQDVPSDRVNAPIYIGINGKVIDVSYGGYEMYAEGGPYHLFAGKDVSRALAKMSFKDEDISSYDTTDLNEEQLKTLDEWETKFIITRKYPIVGSLIK
jgi:membrane-associated progesterone receptor component